MKQAKFQQIQMMKGGDRARAKDLASVAFMYQKPPGWKDEVENAALEAESQVYCEVSPSLSSYKNTQQADASITCFKTYTYILWGRGREQDVEKKEIIKRDIYGNKVATEEQFEVLKNAPRLASVGKHNKSLLIRNF